MKADTRRFLEEDWDAEDPEDAPQFQPLKKQQAAAPPNTRRQQSKEWGRSMAKLQRQRRKSQDQKPS